MTPNASADWASAILGLHQLLSDHLEKSQPDARAVRLPEPMDWLQTMARAAAPGLAPAMTSPLGLEGLAADSGRDGLWESAAQRYRSAAFALQAAWLEIGSHTFDALRQALELKSAPQDLRGIYDLWVACGEKSFARQGATERYADLVAELINAQVSLLLASGIGSAPPPPDPAELKDELARAHAREARLRADLEALRQADTGKAASTKGRAATKNAQPAKAAKKKKSTKKAKAKAVPSAPGTAKTSSAGAASKRKKTGRKQSAAAKTRRRSKP
ncbi:MAG TPA: hypothetical protein DG761_02180 [Gammaproteobacteria bacterium]|jgi:hypothetical protein|nr:hypothetical protein [Acidiferrobacteraceae bacterium]MDP6552529.1 poly(R)-hydroxyalkanoic acid synthase subunit PhaE [Arenicellales bacterium]MDP6791694.1 poly(R)-hydroxyalkanoic acid synthase subunit PhaE [Arenicellales bacterium]MDP6918617.1 poly(R)-hydroxyalkanoic acid synthase subunit PhaE [Arenicellales bacterium]HCX86814.1 hypothetical protein [Gammaproteobacteria bacterium]|tara:strand:- start:3880 stop:4701 length:822 start_codon:yes stop_codon:yes gene_type:complete